MTISRVLVGVDFDEASESALRVAAALAAGLKADVTLFHAAVLEVPAYFTAAQMVALESEREQSRAAVAARLRAFASKYLPTAVDVLVGEGPPQDGMLEIAASFDLIVVGTHRRHGPQRWWLGSVAEAVVRRSPRPVLVVPAGAVVRETRRRLMMLTAGENPIADAWVNTLETVFEGAAVRAPDIQQCTPDGLQHADLVVLAMPLGGGDHPQFGAIVQVLKECTHPVLFVPSAEGLVERSQP
jgi:nucleotide-binding universal stress UspA family protein